MKRLLAVSLIMLLASGAVCQFSSPKITGANYGVNSTGLIGWWKLSEGTGSTAYDSSLSGLNGAWQGTQSGTSGYNDAGYVGPYSGHFNGTNNYIDLGANPGYNFTNTQAFSVTAWMKASSFTTEETFVANMTSSGTYQGWSFEYGLGSTQGLNLYLINNYTGSNYINVSRTNTTLDNGSWHFVAMTYTGSSTAAGVTLYIDGGTGTQLNNKDALTGTMANSSHQTIGSRVGGAQPLTADLDDVRIYNRVLSSATITAMYAIHNTEIEQPEFPWLMQRPMGWEAEFTA